MAADRTREISHTEVVDFLVLGRLLFEMYNAQ